MAKIKPSIIENFNYAKLNDSIIRNSAVWNSQGWLYAVKATCNCSCLKLTLNKISLELNDIKRPATHLKQPTAPSQLCGTSLMKQPIKMLITHHVTISNNLSNI